MWTRKQYLHLAFKTRPEAEEFKKEICGGKTYNRRGCKITIGDGLVFTAHVVGSNHEQYPFTVVVGSRTEDKMAEIIKAGKPVKETATYKHAACGSTVMFVRTDVQSDRDGDHVICPVCKAPPYIAAALLTWKKSALKSLH